MFSRSISLLFVVGILTSLLGRMPHAHNGLDDLREYEQAAHVHVCVSHSHDDDHHHEHDGDEGNHDEDAPEQTASVDSPIDHEYAIYVVADDFIISKHEVSKQQLDPTLLPAACFTAADDRKSVQTPGRFWRPPDSVIDDSDCYLFLRQLRI